MDALFISSVFKIAEHTLGIYKTKQARIYLDRVIYLKKEYSKESNKNEESQNHAYLDNIASELRIIIEAITIFGKQDFEN